MTLSVLKNATLLFITLLITFSFYGQASAARLKNAGSVAASAGGGRSAARSANDIAAIYDQAIRGLEKAIKNRKTYGGDISEYRGMIDTLQQGRAQAIAEAIAEVSGK